MDINDLNFCYDNLKYLLSHYCNVGCLTCKYREGYNGDCLKQILKKILDVRCDYNIKMKSLKTVYELLNIIWDNVKEPCNSNTNICEECLFHDKENNCKRKKIREMMEKNGGFK